MSWALIIFKMSSINDTLITQLYIGNVDLRTVTSEVGPRMGASVTNSISQQFTPSTLSALIPAAHFLLIKNSLKHTPAFSL